MEALVFGLLRHALQLAAGILVARGYMDESMTESVVGGALAIGSAAWFAAGKIRK